MTMRVSGINSGLDTESMVKELVSAYSKKTEKYEKQLTKNEWKKEAWESLNTDVYSLYTSVSSMRFSSAYSLKTATSSNTSKATVSASSTAINASQTLYIKHTAQTSYLTGAKIKNGITSDTKLSDIGYKAGNGNIQIIDAEGKTKDISISNDTTIGEFVTQLQNNGLNASFDDASGRIFVSAKNAGASNDFTLLGSDDNGQEALTKLGLSTSIYTTAADGTKSFADGSHFAELYKYYRGASDGKTAYENTEAYINSVIDQYFNEKNNYDHANTYRAQAKVELENLNKDLTNAKKELDEFDQDAYDAATTAIADFRSANGLEADEDWADFMALSDADKKAKLMDATTLQDASDTSVGYGMTEEEADAFLANLTTAATSKSDLEDAVTAAQAAVDSKQADIDAYTVDMENATEAMKANPLLDLIENEDGEAYDAERRTVEIRNYLQSVLKTAEMLENPAYGSGTATKVTGVDSEIELNGVTYKGTSNTFTINGLTINCTGTTTDDSPIMINVATDAQGIYDKVKDFLTKYNEIINKITELYNAESSGEYEPLTDDEKDAMSDTEIEKWESKIKSALLRRDTTLSGIMTVMMNSMSSSFTINGEKMSLTNFGIHTLGYLNAGKNQQNAYHIDGDEDDENTSGNKEKLMEAINNDPDSVVEFMKSLTSKLYTELDGKMKSTSLSSAYKVYNDKELDSENTSIKSTIKKWEDKVSDKEDYYYSKFTQMEKALGKLNSQQTSFTNMLGTS